WCDLTQTAPSMTANADADPLVSAGELDDYAEAYVGDGDRRDPLVSPRFADLAGLPPLLVQVGEPEVLLDDARAVATAAEEAGTEVTLDVWPDVFHVWQASAGMTPEGDRAVDQIGAFLATQLDPPTAG
ncbi:MAG: alpha/beta hydrolase fold domain-containing protein, partial [Actinomycetota bacterium]